MQGTAARRATLGLAMLALSLGACGNVASPAESQVEIIDWWTAGGEADAINALLGLFQTQYPNETPLPMPIEGSDTARATIKERMIEGDPPDTFQANGGWDLLTWVAYNNADASVSKMDAIDAAAEGWADVMPSAVLKTVTFQDKIYGVPLDIHRENTLFYNENLFAKFNLTEPQTLDEMFALAAKLQSLGIVAPIALGTKYGTLPIIFFENLLVSRAGSDYYYRFMVGQGDPFGQEIATAVDDLATLVTYANANSDTLDWTGAANRVLTGDAAMTIMGDWDKAYMMSQMAMAYVPGPSVEGGSPGDAGPPVDAGAPTDPGTVYFGAVPTPGTKGTFIFTTDTFGLPSGAPNRTGTIDLLTTFGSKEGQDRFNKIKGSISPRADTDTSQYDLMSRQTIADFTAASQASLVEASTAILAPQTFITPINKALVQFVADGNKSTLIHTINNYYDLMRGPLP